MANGTQYSFQRIEKKYFISPAQAETMLGEMRQHMTADRYGEYAIGNIYCDTDNFRLIRASLEKPAYKEKLRIRCYGVPKAGYKVFVELKKKCGGVVYKRRVTAPLPQAERFLRTETAPAEWGQIGQELQWFQRFYDTMPRMYIGYDRTAWAGTEDPALRITFDRNIRWRRDRLTLDMGDDGKRLLPEDQIPKGYYTALPKVNLAGMECMISRTGYTGELGYEIYTANENAPKLWKLLREAGEEFGLIPCGLGARDTLRLEAAMPLYGHEMDETVTPLEAGLDFAVKLNKPEFIGKDALVAAGTPQRVRVGLAVTGRGIVREHQDLFLDGEKIGHTTSGTHCPFLGKALAMGLIDATDAAVGTALEADVRGRRVAVEIVPLPFYKRG